MSALALTNFQAVKITINTAAELAKQQALDGAKSIVEITDAASQQAGVDALARCKRFTKRLENDRTEVKAPVLKLGKDIDAMANKFAEEVETEAIRLNALIKDYVRKEAQKAADAQRMRDQLAEKKRQREAEVARLADEERQRLEASAAKVEDPEQAAELVNKAADAARAADEARQRAENVSSSMVAAPARSDGMSVRKVWKHRILDVAKLYAARPELCSLEPKTNLINTVIRQGGERVIPGLEIFEEIDTTIRS